MARRDLYGAGRYRADVPENAGGEGAAPALLPGGPAGPGGAAGNLALRSPPPFLSFFFVLSFFFIFFSSLLMNGGSEARGKGQRKRQASFQAENRFPPLSPAAVEAVPLAALLRPGHRPLRMGRPKRCRNASCRGWGADTGARTPSFPPTLPEHPFLLHLAPGSPVPSPRRRGALLFPSPHLWRTARLPALGSSCSSDLCHHSGSRGPGLSPPRPRFPARPRSGGRRQVPRRGAGGRGAGEHLAPSRLSYGEIGSPCLPSEVFPVSAVNF